MGQKRGTVSCLRASPHSIEFNLRWVRQREEKERQKEEAKKASAAAAQAEAERKALATQIHSKAAALAPAAPESGHKQPNVDMGTGLPKRSGLGAKWEAMTREAAAPPVLPKATRPVPLTNGTNGTNGGPSSPPSALPSSAPVRARWYGIS